MAERKSFLLRLPTDVLEAMQRWARDDLRSLNAQIEFVLRETLRRRGRAPVDAPTQRDDRHATPEDAVRKLDELREAEREGSKDQGIEGSMD